MKTCIEYYRCDRCKANIPRYEYLALDNNKRHAVRVDKLELDLCNNCTESLVSWLNSCKENEDAN